MNLDGFQCSDCLLTGHRGTKNRLCGKTCHIQHKFLGLAAARGLIVASRGHFSGRSLCHSGLPQVPFPKRFLLTKWNDGVAVTKNANAT
jgi:hypothetical protein